MSERNTRFSCVSRAACYKSLATMTDVYLVFYEPVFPALVTYGMLSGSVVRQIYADLAKYYTIIFDTDTLSESLQNQWYAARAFPRITAFPPISLSRVSPAYSRLCYYHISNRPIAW